MHISVYWWVGATERSLQTQNSHQLISFMVDHKSQYSNERQIYAIVQCTFKSPLPGSKDSVNVTENEIADLYCWMYIKPGSKVHVRRIRWRIWWKYNVYQNQNTTLSKTAHPHVMEGMGEPRMSNEMVQVNSIHAPCHMSLRQSVKWSWMICLSLRSLPPHQRGLLTGSVHAKFFTSKIPSTQNPSIRDSTRIFDFVGIIFRWHRIQS